MRLGLLTLELEVQKLGEVGGCAVDVADLRQMLDILVLGAEYGDGVLAEHRANRAAHGVLHSPERRRLRADGHLLAQRPAEYIAADQYWNRERSAVDHPAIGLCAVGAQPPEDRAPALERVAHTLNCLAERVAARGHVDGLRWRRRRHPLARKEPMGKRAEREAREDEQCVDQGLRLAAGQLIDPRRGAGRT